MILFKDMLKHVDFLAPNGQNSYVVKKNFTALAHDDYAAELAHWICKFSARIAKSNNPQTYGHGALKLIIILLANFNKVNDSMAGELATAVNTVMSLNFDKEFKSLLECKSSSSFNGYHKKIREMAESGFKEFEQFFGEPQFIEIESDPAQAEEMAFKCDRAYNKENYQTAVNHILKRKLTKVKKSNKLEFTLNKLL
mmetsp:Transcript_28177/g.24960  ORF Transcript_28177/g.24960 Transcript_28177/m.24960 type:complete len:197 (+) Transcript_28177:7038-7628(+)